MEKIKQCLCDQFQQNWNDIFNPVQKPLIIEFSNILLDLKIILTYQTKTIFWYFGNLEQLTIDYQLSVVDGKIQKEKTESVIYVILILAMNSIIFRSVHFFKMKEKLILRKICTEGPTSYALKKLCHPKINRIL